MSDHLNPHLLDHEWNRFSAWLTEQGHDPTLPVDPTYVAAYRVSLSEGYSGHSPRIGKALDLVQEGCSVAQILQAGRWHSPDLIPYFRPSGESRDSEEQQPGA